LYFYNQGLDIVSLLTLLQGVKMIKPLSVWKYYRNNPKKVAIVLMMVSLSIFLQYALLIYMATWQKQAYALEPFKLNSNIYVRAQKSKQSRLKQLLGNHPAISRAFPLGITVTSRPNGRAFIFSFHSKDMNPALNVLDLVLIKGRLPAAGTREMALHRRLAALKELKIGDRFGRQYSGRDYLKGEYKLVGLLDGDLLIGLADLDPYFRDYPSMIKNTGFLVVPHKGQFDKVVRFLNQCVREDPQLYTFYRGTFLKNDILVLNALYLAITCIVTICVIFLFYLYLYERRPEFCLLEALGYTRPMIIGKAFLVIGGIGLTGWMLGGIAGWLSGRALSGSVFVKQGLPLELWKISYPFKLLLTPIVIVLSSLWIVRRMLKKVDPISAIEGEG
jgi:hypothetical protein